MEKKEEELRKKEMLVEARDVEGIDVNGERKKEMRREKMKIYLKERKRRWSERKRRKYLRE